MAIGITIIVVLLIIIVLIASSGGGKGGGGGGLGDGFFLGFIIGDILSGLGDE